MLLFLLVESFLIFSASSFTVAKTETFATPGRQQCKHDNCENDGRCLVDFTNKEICHCGPQYTGEKCQATNPCFLEFHDKPVCRNNGTCIPKPVSDLYVTSCQCEKGFTGELCERTVVPQCDEQTCNGGSCSLDGNRIHCSCKPNRLGSRCELIDSCQQNPCRNGGICVLHNNPDPHTVSGNYSCKCRSGWTGLNCYEDVDECSLGNVCGEGICENVPGSFRCQCFGGMDPAENCRIHKDWCWPNPCHNKGVCYPNLTDFTCHCEPGFHGRRCELEKPGCDQCSDKSFCEYNREQGRFICRCEPGSTGLHCEDDCERFKRLNGTQYCHNNGRCVVVGASLANSSRSPTYPEVGKLCFCNAGSEGTRCDLGQKFCDTANCAGRCNEELKRCESVDFVITRGITSEHVNIQQDDAVNLTLCRNAEYCRRVRSDGQCNPECNSVACGLDGADCDVVMGMATIDVQLNRENFSNNIETKLLRFFSKRVGAHVDIWSDNKGNKLLLPCQTDDGRNTDSLAENCVRVLVSMAVPVCGPTEEINGSETCIRDAKDVSNYISLKLDNLSSDKDEKPADYTVHKVEAYVQSPARDLADNISFWDRIFLSASSQKLAIGLATLLVMLLLFFLLSVLIRGRTALEIKKKIPLMFDNDGRHNGMSGTAKKRSCNDDAYYSIDRKRAHLTDLKQGHLLKADNIETELTCNGHNASCNEQTGDTYSKLLTAFTGQNMNDIQRAILVGKHIIGQKGSPLALWPVSGETLLHVAVRYGRLRIVEVILQMRPELCLARDKFDMLPIHTAASSLGTPVSILSKLIFSRPQCIDALDRDGFSPLHLAIRLSLNDAVGCLLSHKCSVDLKHEETSNAALHYAAAVNNTAAIVLLIGHGADVNVLNARSQTPLFLAVVEGNKEAVIMLLNYGAVVNVADSVGRNPMIMATSLGHHSIAAILQNVYLTQYLDQVSKATVNKTAGKSSRRMTIGGATVKKNRGRPERSRTSNLSLLSSENSFVMPAAAASQHQSNAYTSFNFSPSNGPVSNYAGMSYDQQPVGQFIIGKDASQHFYRETQVLQQNGTNCASVIAINNHNNNNSHNNNDSNNNKNNNNDSNSNDSNGTLRNTARVTCASLNNHSCSNNVLQERSINCMSLDSACGMLNTCISGDSIHPAFHLPVFSFHDINTNQFISQHLTGP